MLSLEQKIEVLKAYLLDVKDNYADSFKTDVLYYFDEFNNIEKHKGVFNFLNELNTKDEIHNLIDSLTSKIVLKFNEDEEQLSDFIFYSINS